MHSPKISHVQSKKSNKQILILHFMQRIKTVNYWKSIAKFICLHLQNQMIWILQNSGCFRFVEKQNIFISSSLVQLFHLSGLVILTAPSGSNRSSHKDKYAPQQMSKISKAGRKGKKTDIRHIGSSMIWKEQWLQALKKQNVGPAITEMLCTINKFSCAK